MKLVPATLPVREMNLPLDLRAFGVRALKRELAEIRPFLVVSKNPEARGLALDAAVGVLVTAVRGRELAQVRGRLRADEVLLGAVADAGNADARMDFARVDLFERKAPCRFLSRSISHRHSPLQRAIRGGANPSHPA